MTVKTSRPATTCTDYRQVPGVDGELLTLPDDFPREPSDFAGRGPELDRLRTAILARLDMAERSPVIAAVTGAPGIGKTAFARRLARSLVAHRPEVLLYADARDGRARAVPPTELLDRFLRRLGVPHDRLPVGYDDQVELYCSLLAGRRVLVLLDDVCNAVQVESVLPIGASGVLLLTGRRMPPALEDTLTLSLDPLDRTSALALLTGLVGPTRVACDPRAAERLLDACDGDPQALRLAGTRLGSRPRWPMAEYARAMCQVRAPAGAAPPSPADAAGTRAATAVMFGTALPARTAADAAFLLAYGRLGPAALRMLRRLGELPGPAFPADLAACLAGYEPSDPVAVDALAELADAGLIEADAASPERYRLSGLVRERARMLFDGEEPATGQQMVRRVLLGWYLEAVGAPAATAEPAAAWSDHEREGAQAMVQLGAAHRLDAPVARLAAALAHSALAGGGRPRQVRDVVEVWLKVTRRSGDRAGQADALSARSTLQVRQGRFAEAADGFRAALAIRRELGDVSGQAPLMAGLGSVYAECDDPDLAAEWYRRALGLHRGDRGSDIADTAWEARLWARLGAVRVRQGRFDEAMRCLRTALDGYRYQGDEAGVARMLSNQGVVLDRLGRAEEALRHYRFAMEVARRAGDQHSEAHALLLLSAALEAAGESSSSGVYRRDADAALARLHPLVARELRSRMSGAAGRRAGGGASGEAGAGRWTECLLTTGT